MTPARALHRDDPPSCYRFIAPVERIAPGLRDTAVVPPAAVPPRYCTARATNRRDGRDSHGSPVAAQWSARIGCGGATGLIAAGLLAAVATMRGPGALPIDLRLCQASRSCSSPSRTCPRPRTPRGLVHRCGDRDASRRTGACESARSAAVLPYRNRADTPRDICKALAVDYVLSGTIAGAGGRHQSPGA